MQWAFALVDEALSEVSRATHVLLLDIRRGAVKNDPTFESAFKRERRQMTAGWAHVVLIVGTPLGVAQVERHAREDGGRYRAFTSEGEALAFARSVPR